MTVSNPSPGIQGATSWNAIDLRRMVTAIWAHGTDGKLISGVVPGFGSEFSVTINSTTLAITVGTGAAVLGAPNPGEGGWPLVNPTSWSGTIAARDATNPRIDLLIARAADSSYYAGGDNLLAIEVITGTAQASPVAPSVPLSHGSYITLGQITVPAGTATVTFGNNTAYSTVPRVGPAGSQTRTWSCTLKQTNNISLTAGKNTGKWHANGSWLEGQATITTAATHSGGGGIPLVGLPVPVAMPQDNMGVLGNFCLNAGHQGYWSGDLVIWSPTLAGLKESGGQWVTNGASGNFDLGAGSILTMMIRYPLA